MDTEEIFKYSPTLFNVVRIGYGVNPPTGVPLDLYYKTINQYSEFASNDFQHKHLIISGNEQCLDSIIDAKIDPSVDRRHGYNADNIIRLANSGVEIFVSEVSSRYGAEKKDKHATDHYKGMFAQLSMLKAVADKYEHATVETMLKQKVFFLQAYNQCLYLWSMKAVESNLYCLCREKKVAIPHEFSDRQDTVLDFICFVNEMKVILSHALKNLQALQNEHQAMSKKRRYLEKGTYQTLQQLITPTIIKVSALKGCAGLAETDPTSGLDMPFLYYALL